MNYKSIKFPRNEEKTFTKELKTSVQKYFKDNKISIHANSEMIIKSVILICAYLTPLILMVFGIVVNQWLVLLCWIFMGVMMAGVGFSVMHDANHGAYSKKKWLNKTLGHVINLLGGSSSTWKIQHNVLHHTYTNIDGADEDIDPGILMRLSPHAKHYKLHRFQHIYGWFLYMFMTFLWITTKDFRQLFRYKKMGLTKTQNINLKVLLVKIMLSKIVYYSIFLIVPILTIPLPWWQTLIYFITMHFIAGFLLGIVFQPAHIMPTTKFPLPKLDGKLENDWTIHQLYTTTNFSPKNQLLSWYVGGLNYQVEHHLFPNICHVHYPKLSKIIKKIASKYNHPYHSQPTFWEAIKLHANMLKSLGRPSFK